MSPAAAFAVAGHLQLALRHPQTTGGSAELVRQVIEQIKGKFHAYPATAEALRRGDTPEYDNPAPPPHKFHN